MSIRAKKNPTIELTWQERNLLAYLVKKDIGAINSCLEALDSSGPLENRYALLDSIQRKLEEAR